MHPFQIAFLIIIGIFGLTFLLSPLVILIKQWQKAPEHLVPLEEGDLPETIRPYFETTALELKTIGFEHLATFLFTGMTPQVEALGAFYRRPQAPGLAGIFAMFQDIKGEKQLGLTYLEFSTEFETGHDLCTNNSTQLPPWPSQPDKIMYSLPQVQDAARLYQVHQAMITHHRELVRPRPHPAGKQSPTI